MIGALITPISDKIQGRAACGASPLHAVLAGETITATITFAASCTIAHETFGMIFCLMPTFTIELSFIH
jgi:hypothetical protein